MDPKRQREGTSGSQSDSDRPRSKSPRRDLPSAAPSSSSRPSSAAQTSLTPGPAQPSSSTGTLQLPRIHESAVAAYRPPPRQTPSPLQQSPDDWWASGIQSPSPEQAQELVIDPSDRAEIIKLSSSNLEWSREQLYKEFNRDRRERQKVVKSMEEFNNICDIIDREPGEHNHHEDGLHEESQKPASKSAYVSSTLVSSVNSWPIQDNRTLLEIFNTPWKDRYEKGKALTERLGKYYGHKMTMHDQYQRLLAMEMTLEKIDKLIEDGFDHIPAPRMLRPPRKEWTFEDEMKVLRVFRHGKELTMKRKAECFNELVETGRQRGLDAIYKRWERLVDYDKSPSDEQYEVKLAALKAKIDARPEQNASG